MKEIYEVKNTLTEDFSFKTNKVLVVQTFVNSLDVRTTALVVQEGRGFKSHFIEKCLFSLGKTNLWWSEEILQGITMVAYLCTFAELTVPNHSKTWYDSKILCLVGSPTCPWPVQLCCYNQLSCCQLWGHLCFLLFLINMTSPSLDLL